MSKKEQKQKKNLYKALTEYFIHNVKTVCHHQKVFWIRLPLSAWKQDYLPHSDKIKKYQKAQKKCNKANEKNTGFKSNSPAMGCG